MSSLAEREAASHSAHSPPTKIHLSLASSRPRDLSLPDSLASSRPRDFSLPDSLASSRPRDFSLPDSLAPSRPNLCLDWSRPGGFARFESQACA